MVTRLALLVACAACAAWAGALSACPCGDGRPRVIYDGFEATCAEAPCGWEVDQGEVAAVATLHGGEHGLRLSGGATLTRDIEGIEVEDDEAAFELLVRCEAATAVRVTLVLDAGARALSATTTPSTSDAATFTSVTAPLTETSGAARGGTASAVHVGLVGSGACVIDELFVFSGAPFVCE